MTERNYLLHPSRMNVTGDKFLWAHVGIPKCYFSEQYLFRKFISSNDFNFYGSFDKIFTYICVLVVCLNGFVLLAIKQKS